MTPELKGYPGRLIAVEGIDGSGKTTQTHLLKRWLELQNLKVYHADWSTFQLVKKTTTRAEGRQLITPTTHTLLHATDFGDIYDLKLLPLLKAGYLVVCDRYVFAAFAASIVRGCPQDWVTGVYGLACFPDITLFLNARLETAVHRILRSRPELNYFDSGMDLRLSPDTYDAFRIYQERLQEQYLAMGTRFDFHMIDGDQPIEAQQQTIRQLIAGKLSLDDFTHDE